MQFSLGAMNEAEVLDCCRIYICYCISDVIYFFSKYIFSVKKFIKSLLLNCEGIFRSGEIC